MHFSPEFILQLLVFLGGIGVALYRAGKIEANIDKRIDKVENLVNREKIDLVSRLEDLKKEGTHLSQLQQVKAEAEKSKYQHFVERVNNEINNLYDEVKSFRGFLAKNTNYKPHSYGEIDLSEHK